jgi:hypothetical protein
LVVTLPVVVVVAQAAKVIGEILIVQVTAVLA